MLNALIRFCVTERLIVLLVTGLTISAGWYCTQKVPIDAIPNIGENQVIVFTPWPGRSPKDVEDQLTYPLSVALLAVPGADSVRGKSLFGYSFVQVTFADNVDFYWARSRVAEQLTTVGSVLPPNIAPTIGPDATALGQVLYYTLTPTDESNLADLRSLQDFVIKYELQSVPGVSEVASVGGYVRQYQIEIDPNKLRYYSVSLNKVIKAVRESNIDVGAKTVESNGMEFIIRGKGFIGAEKGEQQSLDDIQETVVQTRDGIPIRVRDLGRVQVGPMFRRGAIDLNGSEAVGGVIVMRYGENPREVIDAVKKKMKSVESGMNGVKFNLVYDRSGLINATVNTLTTALKEEVVITIIVIILFLLHIRSSLVVAIILPISVLMAFIAMYLVGIDANIMSLAGIAIAVGTMVDMGIIVSENIYRHLAETENLGEKKRIDLIVSATSEVAPAVVTAVTTTVISFLPVFFLTGRDYKLFAPLAWTKTFALISSLIVALFLVPLLSRMLIKSVHWSSKKRIVTAGISALLATFIFGGLLWYSQTQIPADLNSENASQGIKFVFDWIIENLGVTASLLVIFVIVFSLVWQVFREKIRPVENNPVSQIICRTYEPTLKFFLAHKFLFLSLPALILFFGLGAWFGLPAIFRPVESVAQKVGANLNGVPGYVSLKHSLQGLKSDDWIALDEGSWFYMPTLYPAASFSQVMEVLQTQNTLIKKIPEVENVLGKIGRIESALDPAPVSMIETYVMLKPKADWREGVDAKQIWDEINAVATLPGVTPASPLQPIEGRVVMLQSGIKAPMAIRIYGDDLSELAKASLTIAERLKILPEVNSGTVNPDIVLGKPYIEFEVDRKAAARFQMSTQMVNEVVESALGGINVTRTVEGRERYPIQIRYQRNAREQLEDLKKIPVVTPSGETVPLQNLTQMEMTWGPGGISSENARLVAHVSFSPSGLLGDLETVEAVEKSLYNAMELPKEDKNSLTLPDGYVIQAVGSFQNQIEANQRLVIIVPIVILVNFLIIYLQFRTLPISIAVFCGIPVAFAGGMILIGLSGVEMNTAIWIGFIALFGIAIDDGVVMATYLDQIFRERKLTTVNQIREATIFAGLKRIRPCLMTTVTTLAALIPVLMATGQGADIARAMALPVFGGMLVELVTLFVVPVMFCGYMELKMRSGLYDEYWQGIKSLREEEKTPVTTEI